jgi:hypothetical protein
MITNNYTGLASLLSLMADSITSEDLPNILSHVNKAQDECLVVSVCLNRVASFSDFTNTANEAEMLPTSNLSVSDLNHSLNELRKLCQNLKSLHLDGKNELSIIASVADKPCTASKPKTRAGGNK